MMKFLCYFSFASHFLLSDNLWVKALVQEWPSASDLKTLGVTWEAVAFVFYWHVLEALRILPQVKDLASLSPPT